MSAIVQEFEHSLALPFFGIGMKTDLFQSSGHCWVFQICWHIECSALTASSFRIWRSSAGIPSPPLSLFIVMLPKACLTLHSRMPGSRWGITSSWLSRSLRSFLYSSSVYSSRDSLVYSYRASLVTQMVKNMPVMWETQVQPLGQEDSLGKKMAKAIVHRVTKSRTRLSG